MTELVSVVIPTRDRWELLPRAVRSVLAQEHAELHVVVVDDGSVSPAPRDGVFADPRVQVVRRKRSGGVAAARNAGLERARGGWVAFLDDDDIWAPAKLAAQLAAARAVGRPRARRGVREGHGLRHQ